MLKFNLNTPSGLSGFLKNLKRAFVQENMDIRQTKDSKILHRAADAFDFESWVELSKVMESVLPSGNPESREMSAIEVSAQSTLDDLLKVNEAIRAGDEDADLSDCIYASALTRMTFTYVLGADRDIELDVKLIDGECHSLYAARIIVRTFGEHTVLEPKGKDFDRIEALFESRLDLDVESRLGGY